MNAPFAKRVGCVYRVKGVQGGREKVRGEDAKDRQAVNPSRGAGRNIHLQCQGQCNAVYCQYPTLQDQLNFALHCKLAEELVVQVHEVHLPPSWLHPSTFVQKIPNTTKLFQLFPPLMIRL